VAHAIFVVCGKESKASRVLYLRLAAHSAFATGWKIMSTERHLITDTNTSMDLSLVFFMVKCHISAMVICPKYASCSLSWLLSHSRAVLGLRIRGRI
jgi:hypothetical protein